MVSVTENVERLLALIVGNDVDVDAFNFVKNKLVKMIERSQDDKPKTVRGSPGEDRWQVIERGVAP
jgi:hypothetical protein